MKAGLYPKLAWDGIHKNKRFYLPYILTCIGMVMMFYIIHYLAAMPTLKDMPGGRTMEMVLGFGSWIVALFAVIFLFYTNSFLMRRRQKEFGLYNMLGMGKGHLSILLFLGKCDPFRYFNGRRPFKRHSPVQDGRIVSCNGSERRDRLYALYQLGCFC